MKWRTGATLSLFLLLIFVPVTFAQYQDSGCRVHSYGDADGDSQPDYLVLSCAFATENDRVMAIDRNGDMVEQVNWYDSVDLENDLWLFDARADNVFELAISFERTGAGLTAALFDGLGSALTTSDFALVVQDGGKELLHNRHPSVRVVAPHGWWTRSEAINYNIDLELDGSIEAIFDRSMLASIANDGTVDFGIQVRDKDNDGAPDYEIRHGFLPSGLPYSVSRTWIGVSTGNGRPLDRDALIWPYLGMASGHFLQESPSLHAPILVDWETGLITVVSEFIRSHGSENVWYAQAHLPATTRDAMAAFLPLSFEESRLLDFENPFAFYDIAEDDDGRPELSIRQQIWRFGVDTSRKNYNIGQSLRYSWDQNNDGYWDYAIKLVGNKPLTSSVQIGDFSILSVPYETYPYWATENVWGAITFVAAEEFAYTSSEGIYDWDMLGPVWEAYAAGILEQAPTETTSSIRPGMRGEFVLGRDSEPMLYLSSVDRKLHLVRAQAGTWQLDDSQEIQYENLGGDYIDCWKLKENNETLETLCADSAYAVYSGTGVVVLGEINVDPGFFMTLPPRNHKEWTKLGADLSRYEVSFAPDDFRAMIDQFDGLVLTILDASMRDFRLTDDGFRFVLNLQAGYKLDGPDLLNIQDWHPGEYVVEYDGSEFTAQPLSPAVVLIEQLGLASREDAVQALTWTTLQSLVVNRGLEDEQNLLLCAYLEGPVGGREILTSTLTLLPGQGRQVVAWDWLPLEAGLWRFSVATDCGEVSESGSSVQILGQTVVEVSDAAKPPVRWLVSLGGLVPEPTILFLFATVVVAGLVAAFCTRQTSV